MTGYCNLHDRDYKITSGDEVCPRCLRDKDIDLAARDYAQDLEYEENRLEEYGDMD